MATKIPDNYKSDVVIWGGGGGGYGLDFSVSRIHVHVRGWVKHFWATTFKNAPAQTPTPKLIHRSLYTFDN